MSESDRLGNVLAGAGEMGQRPGGGVSRRALPHQALDDRAVPGPAGTAQR
ncbi:hypothetical protein [Amycolatopsis sp. NPDC051128]